MFFPSPDQFKAAIEQTRPFQVRGIPGRARNPITGAVTTIDPTRSFRPRPPSVGDKLSTPAESCDFCLSRTIPPIAICDGHDVAVPNVSGAVERGRRWVEEQGPVTTENFRGLLEEFRSATSPNETLATTFPNICPVPGLGSSLVVNSFVTSVHPRFHDRDISECPVEALDAIVHTWKALQHWSQREGHTAVPYINGGRDRRSGQSFPHPHTQITIFEEKPDLFRSMHDAKLAGHCAICELRAMESFHIPVPEADGLIVMAHPAPEHSWSVVILARECSDDFLQVDSSAFSRSFRAVAGALASVFNGLPPYNLVVRIGTGHFHAEFIPRSTTIVAGGELAIRGAFVDVAPNTVKLRLGSAIHSVKMGA